MKAYKVNEAAEVMSVDAQTIRRAIKKGELVAAKIGNDYRISRHDLNAWYQFKGGKSLFNGGDPEPEEPETGRCN